MFLARAPASKSLVMKPVNGHHNTYFNCFVVFSCNSLAHTLPIYPWLEWTGFRLWALQCQNAHVFSCLLGICDKPLRPETRTWTNKRSNCAARAFYNFVHFRRCSLQNNNVKSPKFAWSENRNTDGKLIKLPFGTQPCLHMLCWSFGLAP